MINIALVMFVFISSCFCNTTNKEETLKACKEFLETNPKPHWLQLSYGPSDRTFWGYFEKPPGKFLLSNHIKLNKTEAVIEDPVETSVCVGMIDTTSYSGTLDHPDDRIAWVTFNTRYEQLVGIVNISTPCWLRNNQKEFKLCGAKFIPMPGFMETALFNYSPLTEEFWNHVEDETVFRKDWIWRMNYASSKASGSINSSWVHRLNISSLEQLEFVGNDWPRPDTLMGYLPKLDKLDLSSNNIEIMPNDTFEQLPALRSIILGHNNISRLPLGLENHKQLRLLDLTNPVGNATLSLSDDDILTMSRIQILGLERTRLEANVTKILNLPNLWFLNMSGCFLGKIDEGSTENSQLEYLDLSFNNLTDVPKNALSKTFKLKHLRLHHNKLQACFNDSFSFLTELLILDLSHNHLDYLDRDCFLNLHNIEELHLSWNKLSMLDPLTFRNATKLKKLYLLHNRLSFLHHELFSAMKELKFLDLSYNVLRNEPILRGNEVDAILLANNSLTKIINMTYSVKRIDYVDLSGNFIQTLTIQNVRTLNLSYNSLTHIPQKMWHYLNSLETVDLGRNHFDCCRNDTALLQQKLNSTSNFIQYLGKNDTFPFTCFINHQEVLLDKFKYNTSLCVEMLTASHNLYIEVGIAVFFLISLVAVTIALLYFYRTELTYISHLFKMKKRGWEKDEERYNVCTYDAFVCYSAKNLKWVAEDLLPNLESEPGGYRLCLHDRDFALGAAIDTNVIASLEKSRKVIFVLTQDFIKSRWCQWELEMANHKMFEENRGYIILIELERVDKKNMPRHLRYLMDTRTYLEWPQDPSDEHKVERCWKRLRQALGDSIVKRTGRGAPKVSVLDL